MSAQPVEPSRPTVTYQRLKKLAEAFEAEAENRGEPVRADIANEEIKVHMMSPSKKHGRIVVTIARQIENQDETAVASSECRIDHPDFGICRTADLLVMEQEVYERDADDDFSAFAPDVSVAFEVVSPSNASNDHVTKLRDYPRMGVPVYVIVDPRDGTITVHSGPDMSTGEPRYEDTCRYKFGDTVQMGPWPVDTGTFPRY